MLAKEIFYKYITCILATMGLLTGICSYMVANYGYNHFYLWFLFILVQTTVGLVLGKLIKNLYNGSYKDNLTGLYNRKYFNRKLNNELIKVKRIKSIVSLLIIDIDNFKKINDKYGHVSGDMVINKLTDIFRQNMRTNDILSRWGGEEFTVILPETNAAGATIFAERLRKIIEDTNLFCGKVTVSIGIASTNGYIDKDNFVAQADKALYKAKEKRNNVVSIGYTGGNLVLIESLVESLNVG